MIDFFFSLVGETKKPEIRLHIGILSSSYCLSKKKKKFTTVHHLTLSILTLNCFILLFFFKYTITNIQSLWKFSHLSKMNNLFFNVVCAYYFQSITLCLYILLIIYFSPSKLYFFKSSKMLIFNFQSFCFYFLKRSSFRTFNTHAFFNTDRPQQHSLTLTSGLVKRKIKIERKESDWSEGAQQDTHTHIKKHTQIKPIENLFSFLAYRSLDILLIHISSAFSSSFQFLFTTCIGSCELAFELFTLSLFKNELCWPARFLYFFLYFFFYLFENKCPSYVFEINVWFINIAIKDTLPSSSYYVFFLSFLILVSTFVYFFFFNKISKYVFIFRSQ